MAQPTIHALTTAEVVVQEWGLRSPLSQAQRATVLTRVAGPTPGRGANVAGAMKQVPKSVWGQVFAAAVPPIPEGYLYTLRLVLNNLQEGFDFPEAPTAHLPGGSTIKKRGGKRKQKSGEMYMRRRSKEELDEGMPLPDTDTRYPPACLNHTMESEVRKIRVRTSPVTCRTLCAPCACKIPRSPATSFCNLGKRCRGMGWRQLLDRR